MQDKLFQLIKSLTKAEKAHFTRFTQIGTKKEKPDYVLLFEAIDKQDDYQEQHIKKLLGKKGLGTAFFKHFSRKKNQLKDKILDSLDLLYAGNSIEAQLRKLLSLVDILYQKKLLDSVESRLQIAKKLALKHQKWLYLIQILDWNIKLEKRKHQALTLLLHEQNQYRLEWNNELEFQHLKIKIQQLITQDIRLRQTKNKETFHQLIVHPLIQNTFEGQSKSAEKNYHYLKSCQYRYQKDFEQAYIHAKHLIELSKLENLQQDGLIDYKNSLCNFLIICDNAKKYEEFPAVLTEIKEIMATTSSSITLLNTIYFLGLRYYSNTFQWTAALDLIQRIEEDWDSLCAVIPKRRRLVYAYNIMIVYWIVGDIKAAIFWLSQILNEHISDETKVVIQAARVLQFPIYYDFQDELLSPRLDTVRKNFAYSAQYLDFEKTVILAFRQLIKKMDKKDKLIIIHHLENKLNQIGEKIFGLEELKIWCKSQLSGKSMKKVIG